MGKFDDLDDVKQGLILGLPADEWFKIGLICNPRLTREQFDKEWKERLRQLGSFDNG